MSLLQDLRAIQKASHILPGVLEEARQRVNTSPTKPQQDAGNYAKGHLAWKGFNISIENPKGSTRSGVSKSGHEWSTTMTADYGYFKRTEGKDGDHLDVYIGPDHSSELVFVVNQVAPDTGKFDEHKVVIGCTSAREARELYLAHYSAGWKGLGSMKAMHIDDFKDWVENGDLTKRAIEDGYDVTGAAERQTMTEPLTSRHVARASRLLGAALPLLKERKPRPAIQSAKRIAIRQEEHETGRLEKVPEQAKKLAADYSNLAQRVREKMAQQPQAGFLAVWYCPETGGLALSHSEKAAHVSDWSLALAELHDPDVHEISYLGERAPEHDGDRHWLKVAARPIAAILYGRDKEAYSEGLRTFLQHTGWIPGEHGLGRVASPITASLATGLLGAGAGYGLGALTEELLPNRWRRGNLRKNFAMMGGAAGGLLPLGVLGLPNLAAGKGLGDTPELTKGPADTVRVTPEGRFELTVPDSGAGLPAFNTDPAASQKATQDLADAFGKQGDWTSGLGGPPPEIPVQDFINTVWSDPRVSEQVSPQIRAATAGLLEAARPPDKHTVGMMDLARLTANMGTGWVAGALVGRALGTLAGMPAETQDRLKTMGIFAGVIRSVVPLAFGGR